MLAIFFVSFFFCLFASFKRPVGFSELKVPALQCRLIFVVMRILQAAVPHAGAALLMQGHRIVAFVNFSVKRAL